MSGNLYIEPIERKKQLIDKDLKYVLQRKKVSYPLTVSEKDLSYFQALRDAEIEGASIVIEYIEKYGECEITEVF